MKLMKSYRQHSKLNCWIPADIMLSCSLFSFTVKSEYLNQD